jgi:hypothetical protein
MRAQPSRIPAAARRLAPVAICALVAHAALYGGWRPAGAAHAYFRWYEPVVLGLALGAAALLVAVLALAALSRRRPALGRWPAAIAGALGSDQRPGPAAARLVPWGAAWLLGQESLERSLAAGTAAPAALDAVAWLVALAALTACAYALDWLGYWSRRLVRGVLGRPDRPRVGDGAVARAVAPAAVDLRRRPPLADRRGLRAPPTAAA